MFHYRRSPLDIFLQLKKMELVNALKVECGWNCDWWSAIMENCAVLWRYAPMQKNARFYPSALAPENYTRRRWFSDIRIGAFSVTTIEESNESEWIPALMMWFPILWSECKCGREYYPHLKRRCWRVVGKGSAYRRRAAGTPIWFGQTFGNKKRNWNNTGEKPICRLSGYWISPRQILLSQEEISGCSPAPAPTLIIFYNFGWNETLLTRRKSARIFWSRHALELPAQAKEASCESSGELVIAIVRTSGVKVYQIPEMVEIP